MPGALTVFHTADSHIGAEMPGRPRLNVHRRGHDFIESFRRAVRRALFGECDLLIHAGDLFDSPAPTAAAILAAGEPLLEVAAAGVPVIIVPGNHERSAIPDCLLLAHRNIHLVTRPVTIALKCEGLNVAVSAFPCIRRASAERFPAVLAETSWQKKNADIRILALHQTLESATCGPAGYRFRSGEDVIDRAAIPDSFHYVACGHVHRHQILKPTCDGQPPIVYSGSPDRISFAEKDEPKGFVRVTLEHERLVPEFVEHEVRPMCVLPLAITGLAVPRIRDNVFDWLLGVAAGAVAQLRLTGSPAGGELTGLRLTELARSLRPDVHFSISAQGIEFERGRDAPRAVFRVRSAFACLDAPPECVASATVDRIAELPASRGVYALYDAEDRLLYVGKAANVRARVRSHLAHFGRANYFKGWAAQVARAEARRAYSDLEAHLVEAELIRRLSPPFNQQMRRWARYCYVIERDPPGGKFTIVAEPVDGCDDCYGPFRSRVSAEQFMAAVALHFDIGDREPAAVSTTGARRRAETFGAFPGARSPAQCIPADLDSPWRVDGTPADRHRRRSAFLRGEDDDSLRELETRLAALSTPLSGEDIEPMANLAAVLRQGFDHLRLLREGRALIGRSVRLSSEENDGRVAEFTREGIRFRIHVWNDPEKILVGQLPADCMGRVDDRPLPRQIIDGLAAAVRALRRQVATGDGVTITDRTAALSRP